MMKKLFLSTFILFSNFIFSQNLILNPSFEDISACPLKYGELKKAKFWQSPSFATPDLFYNCDTVGQNTMWKIEVKNELSNTGNGFVGIVSLFDQYYSHQEYIQGQLYAPLEKDKVYTLKFKIKIADSSNYFLNEISIAFSKNAQLKTKWIRGYDILYCDNCVTIVDSSGLRKNQWIEVSSNYQARGGEKYITIGQFANTFSKKEFKESIKNNRFSKSKNGICSYYIDDLSLLVFSP
jgi:OmpA-OmpF porin, OOP family